ncbi:MAG TPA: flagellar biosynthetic protein FliR [Planctomycetes bacterium]|nr:flagellar biosynthetic protein FliR [Planctomycetota bacterium]
MDPAFLDNELRFYVLHWVRCLALIAPLPVFGNTPGSRVARVGLGVMLGTILAMVGTRVGYTDPGWSPMLALYVVKEALFGFLLAYIAMVGFGAIRMAGDFIGTEMGFNMASISDPITGVNTQLIAHFYETLGLLIFFVSGGHLVLLKALARSFEAWPVTTFTLNGEMVSAVIAFTGGIFVAGLQIAAPVFVAMIVIGVSLAVLAKVAPQLQIFIFAFPVKILGGMLLLYATFASVIPAVKAVLEHMNDFLFQLTGS